MWAFLQSNRYSRCVVSSPRPSPHKHNRVHENEALQSALTRTLKTVIIAAAPFLSICTYLSVDSNLYLQVVEEEGNP